MLSIRLPCLHVHPVPFAHALLPTSCTSAPTQDFTCIPPHVHHHAPSSTRHQHFVHRHLTQTAPYHDPHTMSTGLVIQRSALARADKCQHGSNQTRGGEEVRMRRRTWFVPPHLPFVISFSSRVLPLSCLLLNPFIISFSSRFLLT
ncbi:hypothetical protein EDD22DRAFT_294296 [Suillus occidentalis]|nr:hypothetical protein EDD22DRAFT_294296 [Suillus occidentalis]